MKKIFSVLLALSLVLAMASGAFAMEDTDTVAVGAVVLVKDGVSEDVVYDFVSTIFENLDAVSEAHAKGLELSLEAASSVTAVPYHPGAAKYFAEKGIEVAAVKEGAADGSVSAKKYFFGTGGEAGTYYAFGSVLAQFITNNSGTSVTAVVGRGSKANVEDLTSEDAPIQFAFCQSDVMSYAYEGTSLFEEKLDGFSVVASLYLEQVQIVTLDPSIKTVADLKGKLVSIGDIGSGVNFNAFDCLAAYDLTIDDLKEPVYQGFGDSAESLKNGKIDAFFCVAGAPTTAITELATGGKEVYLVGFDADHIAALIEMSPYYTAVTLPAGTY